MSGENRERRQPGREMGDERSFPNQNETKHDERHVDHRVAEEEDVQDAPRILAEGTEEIR